jgi:hypothetical protein
MRPAGAGLAGLPVPAQGSISAALGRDDPAYHGRASDKSVALDNPRHGFRAAFGARGLTLAAGPLTLALRLSGSLSTVLDGEVLVLKGTDGRSVLRYPASRPSTPGAGRSRRSSRYEGARWNSGSRTAMRAIP